MEFKQTDNCWLSGDYRIVWRDKAFGISVPARFVACVKTIVPGNFENGYTEMWDFVNPDKHQYKTLKAAVADCERHYKKWVKAAKCTGIREFDELIGKKAGTPKWVYSQMAVPKKRKQRSDKGKTRGPRK